MVQQQPGNPFLGINEAQAAAPYWIIVMESYWRQRVWQQQQSKEGREGGRKRLAALSHKIQPASFTYSHSRSRMDVRCAYWPKGRRHRQDVPLGAVNMHKAIMGIAIGAVAMLLVNRKGNYKCARFSFKESSIGSLVTYIPCVA